MQAVTVNHSAYVLSAVSGGVRGWIREHAVMFAYKDDKTPHLRAVVRVCVTLKVYQTCVSVSHYSGFKCTFRLTLVMDYTVCGQQLQQRDFKQSRVKQQFPGCGPDAGITFKAFLDQLLQKNQQQLKKKTKTHKPVTCHWEKYFLNTNRSVKVRLYLICSLWILTKMWTNAPPSAAGPPVAEWRCWWRPEKHTRTLRSHGFPGVPSTHTHTHISKQGLTCHWYTVKEASGPVIQQSHLQDTHAKWVDIHSSGDIII